MGAVVASVVVDGDERQHDAVDVADDDDDVMPIDVADVVVDAVVAVDDDDALQQLLPIVDGDIRPRHMVQHHLQEKNHRLDSLLQVIYFNNSPGLAEYWI